MSTSTFKDTFFFKAGKQVSEYYVRFKEVACLNFRDCRKHVLEKKGNTILHHLILDILREKI